MVRFDRTNSIFQNCMGRDWGALEKEKAEERTPNNDVADQQSVSEISPIHVNWGRINGVRLAAVR